MNIAGAVGFIVKGGILMAPLVICSFVVFVFIFERTISLRRARVVPRPFVRNFLEQLREGGLNRKEALALCRENGSPVAEVFEAGVVKWDRPCVEVEQSIIDAGERVANHLRRHLRLLHGVYTISPLLGLLGTVVGMIQSFTVISGSENCRPEVLASGISTALITTAGGLVVAIPAIVAYLFFSSRVDRFISEIDRYSQEVVNAVACDGWKESVARKPMKPTPKAA